MKKLILAAAIPLALTACGSFKYTNGIELSTPTWSKAEEGDEVKYPKWYKKDEDKSGDKLFGVASEYSSDFQFAVDKTMLSAKRELAAQYSSYISSMMKDFSEEVGASGSVVREIDRTTKLLVAQVNLIGIKREQFEVRHEKSGYRAFVKLSYTTSEANKVLVDAIRRNQQLNARANKSQAFKELEESVRNTNPQGTQQ